MTLDVSSETTGAVRTDAAGPEAWSPEPAPASGNGDEGRRDDGGQDGGGGHTEKARREGRLDLRNGWQVVAGSVLIPLGVIFILIGWYGAAHARVVQQQIPYMVSGSFIGLGCMVVGGFLFWGHWLYRIYDQAELHHEEQQQLLELIAASLMGQGRPGRAGGGGVPGAATGGVLVGATAPAENGTDTPGPVTTFYATATGTVYHRTDCVVIADHPDDLRVFGPGGLTGLRPCADCAPAG